MWIIISPAWVRSSDQEKSDLISVCGRGWDGGAFVSAGRNKLEARK